MTDQTPLTRPHDETVKEQLKDHDFAIAMYEEFGETVKELERLRAKRDAARQQAQVWEQEGRAMHSIVVECYRAVTDSTGEPMSWNEAGQVVELIGALRKEQSRLRARLEIEEGNPYDGIESRDVTIRELEKSIVALKVECDVLRKGSPIPQSDQRDVLIYAFRYTLGRCSYAPHTIVEILHASWDQLSDGDRALYKREIREAIAQGMAGHACDVAAWQSILDLEA